MRSGSAVGRLGQRGPTSPARPGSAARREKLIASSPTKHVVGRDPGRALRAVGRRLADARERVQHLAGRVLGVLRRARERGDAERSLSPGLPAGEHLLHVGASPGPARIWPGRRRNGFFSSRLTATVRGSHRAGSSLMRAPSPMSGWRTRRGAGGSCIATVLEHADEAVRLASADARAARRLAARGARGRRRRGDAARRPSGRWGWPRSSSATRPPRSTHLRRAVAIAEPRRLDAARGRGADEPRAGADAAGRRSRRRWRGRRAPSRRWRARRARGCRASAR